MEKCVCLPSDRIISVGSLCCPTLRYPLSILFCWESSRQHWLYGHQLSCPFSHLEPTFLNCGSQLHAGLCKWAWRHEKNWQQLKVFECAVAKTTFRIKDGMHWGVSNRGRLCRVTWLRCILEPGCILCPLFTVLLSCPMMPVNVSWSILAQTWDCSRLQKVQCSYCPHSVFWTSANIMFSLGKTEAFSVSFLSCKYQHSFNM